MPSLLAPTSSTVTDRLGRARSFVALPEVRWAAVSLVAFLLALAARGLGAPDVLADGLFAVCYLAGGWEPAQRLEVWTSIC